MISSHHEHVPSHSAVTASSDRGFGFVMASALTILSWWKYEEWGRPWTSWLIGSAVAMGLSALLMPRVLRPLNRAWTRLGLLLGRIVTPVVLFLLFVVAFVPLGLLLRLRGFDPLRLELEPGKETYWIDRDPPGPSPDTLVRQF